MHKKIVTSFEELNDFLSKYQNPKTFYFRGQASVEWEIKPKAGREPFNKVKDKTIFEAWKRQAYQFIEKNFDNDWDWLALAQHNGLPTRLLDWTRNPLIAAFFASNELIGEDGVIYVVEFNQYIDTIKNNPFEFEGIRVFHPKIVANRLHSQQGLFSFHSEPSAELTEKSDNVKTLDKIIIKTEFKRNLLSKLNYYGVNALKLFPDLEGLSRYTEWTFESGEYWNLK